jgi:hypothetical protein
MIGECDLIKNYSKELMKLQDERTDLLLFFVLL